MRHPYLSLSVIIACIVVFPVAESLFCTTCQDVDDPTTCPGFAICPPGEVCSAVTYMAPSFSIKHTLSCKPANQCVNKTLSPVVGRRDNDGSSTIQEICCSTTLCNLNHFTGTTTTQSFISTTKTVLVFTGCFDAGDRCSVDVATTSLICNIQPQLCAKTCGLCGTTASPTTVPTTPVVTNTCADPISECQCSFLDKELSICSDPDPKMKMFCCYYCNKKLNKYTCPDFQCDVAEQQEFDIIRHLHLNATCHH